MKPSSSELLSAVANTIEKDVLPALDPADWTSSRLRSSLLILRHLERRIDLERALLEQDNENIRKMLVELRGTLQDEAPEIADLINVQSLSAAGDANALNEACNQMVDAVLQEIYDRRDQLEARTFDAVRRRILSCLTESQERMSPLFDQLDGYSVL